MQIEDGYIKAGVVHTVVPVDLQEILMSHTHIRALWNELTPLARNEWLCFIEDAKKQETRAKRIVRLQHDIVQGKKRPCCWAGCPHK